MEELPTLTPVHHASVLTLDSHAILTITLQSSLFAAIPAQFLYETAGEYRTRVALGYLLGDNNTPNV